jgi:hypothetical protein
MSTQNIINVCLAICITFLIYQNNKLSDEKMDYYDVKRLELNQPRLKLVLEQLNCTKMMLQSYKNTKQHTISFT